ALAPGCHIPRRWRCDPYACDFLRHQSQLSYFQFTENHTGEVQFCDGCYESLSAEDVSREIAWTKDVRVRRHGITAYNRRLYFPAFATTTPTRLTVRQE